MNIIGETNEEAEQRHMIKAALKVVVSGAKAEGLKLFRKPETIAFQFVEEGGKESDLSNGANVLVAFCMTPLVQATQAGEPDLFNWALAYLGENEDVVILENAT